MDAVARRTARLAAIALACSSLVPATLAQCELASLTPIGPQNGSLFGRAIGASEDRVLVSQIALMELGTNRLDDYALTPSGWVFAGEIPNPDPATMFLFGWSLDVAGGFALVGDPNGAGLAGGEGAAFVYERTASGWALRERLFAADGQFGDRFGADVDLDASGSRAIVAARSLDPTQLDPNAPDAKVYVFERGPSGWAQVARLDPATPQTAFGCGVALDGDVAVVGSPGETTTAGLRGVAYVYERGPSGWSLAERLEGPGAQYLGFGEAVGIARETVLVAARHEPAPGTFGGGAVHVYDRLGAGWLETSVLRPSAGTDAFSFGQGIATAPDHVVVWSSSPLAPPGGPHVFERFGSIWRERAQLLDDQGVTYFGSPGRRAAIAGNTVAYAGTSSPNAVQLFDLESVATADVPSISVSAGGVQTLEVRTGCPPRAGLPYIVLGSASGTSTALPVPLVVDLYFFHTLQAPNSAFLADTFGTLDAAGRATARIVLPPAALPAAVGLELDHAFVGLELLPGLLQLTAISNPVHLTLAP